MPVASTFLRKVVVGEGHTLSADPMRTKVLTRTGNFTDCKDPLPEPHLSVGVSRFSAANQVAACSLQFLCEWNSLGRWLSCRGRSQRGVPTAQSFTSMKRQVVAFNLAPCLQH